MPTWFALKSSFSQWLHTLLVSGLETLVILEKLHRGDLRYPTIVGLVGRRAFKVCVSQARFFGGLDMAG